MVDPAFVPHDVDSGPEPKPVTDETTTADGSPAVVENPPPRVTRVRTNPDGTQVETSKEDVTNIKLKSPKKDDKETVRKGIIL